MQAPELFTPRVVAPDTWLIGAWIPVPGLGVLPGNAFVIRSREPVLVDTGLAGLRSDFMRALEQVIDPADLRWIWVTHMDADHIGNLQAVLDRAPKARVVTTYLGLGKMGLLQLPQERAWLLNPGQTLDVGDRQLLALTPPTFDAPETTGLFDARSRALLPADCFGTVLSAPVESAAEIAPQALQDGMGLWTSVDVPWLSMVERPRLLAGVEALRRLQPDVVLSSHLPPAAGDLDKLCRTLVRSADAPPFVGPDQRALEQMMAAQMAQAA